MQVYCLPGQDQDSFPLCLDKEKCLQVLNLIISQKEGEVALARVMIPCENFSWGTLKTLFIFGYLEEKIIPLFKGRIEGLPLKIQGDILSIEASAEPNNSRNQLKKIAQTLKKAPYWDDLFVDETSPDFMEVLEARTSLWHWDRVTGELGLSDLFQGTKSLDVTDIFFPESLTVTLSDLPLSQIDVSVKAEWVQQAEGEFNLYPRIAAIFPEGIINTLTRESFLAAWPKVGDQLGQSGYRVLESNLSFFSPQSTVELTFYPTLTPQLNFGPDKMGRFQRFWARGKLVLGWRYRQKRREKVIFSLKMSTQLQESLRFRRQSLSFHLNSVDGGKSPAIGDVSRSSFFLTERGRQAVEHAIERAKCYLAGQSRCLEITCELPFEKGHILSVDHNLILKDSRLPGGKVIGKVVEYKLTQTGKTAIAWVRILASVGDESPHVIMGSQDLYAEESYQRDKPFVGYQTASGIQYADYFYQQPTKGIISPKALTMADFVEGIFLKNDASSQIKNLIQKQYPTCANLRSVLKEIPTELSIRLLDLTTTDVEEHVIQVDIKTLWVAPIQVHL